MINEEKQVWANEVKELNKSSAEEKQPAEEAPLEEDFMEAQA